MSNSITVTGTVHHIGPVETVGQKGFTKRLLVVHNGDEYNALVPIELKKDKTALADSLQVGQSVTVHVNLGGREWNGKYFASVSAWKIEAGANVAAPVTQPVAEPIGDDSEQPF
jgi:hypothetical protein